MMFELEVMAFILGGILAVVGILGGGLEIKELKIPQINPFTRAMAVAVGLVFVGLGIYLDRQPIVVPDQGKMTEPETIVKFDNVNSESGVSLMEKEEIRSTLFKYGRVKKEGYSQLNVNAWEKILVNPVLEHKKRGTCMFIEMKHFWEYGERIIDIREINFEQDRSRAQVIAMVGEEKVLKDRDTDEVIKRTPFEKDRAIYELEKRGKKWFISCINLWEEGEFKTCTMGPPKGNPCS